VCRWPVGGIRTYLSYNYRHFSRDEFEVTLLAKRERESEYTEEDMKALGVRVVWAASSFGRELLPLSLAWQLLTRRYDLIHSQGFISGFYTSTVNKLFRVPHVLTIHGILEKEYFEGRLERLKRLVFRRALRNVTVFHSVSRDMLEHVQEELPSLKACPADWVVINNGIDPAPFLAAPADAGRLLRTRYGFESDVFVFGFFGRLIHQKGFNYVIDAVQMLRQRSWAGLRFIVLVLSRGDFVREYKADVDRMKLNDYFRFERTQPDIHQIIAGCDAVLMPSNWEAWGLLANEVQCAGVPLIASTCIGLREAIADTPALTVPPGDAAALAEAMIKVMEDPTIKERHQQFRHEAARRFDVKRSAEQLMALFRRVGRRRGER